MLLLQLQITSKFNNELKYAISLQIYNRLKKGNGMLKFHAYAYTYIN